MNYKSLLLRVFTILFGLLLGLGAVLIWKSGRAEEERRQTVPPSRSHKQAATFVYHQTPFYFPFKARPTHMHTQEPFSEVFEFSASHNSQGFRTPEYTIAHPPNTFRILVLGDSITWGQGVAANEIYPQILEKLLVQKCPNRKFEVIALGVRGHRLADNLIKLVVHGQYLKPDLVLFQLCVNDLDFYDYPSIASFQHKANKNIQSIVDKQKEIWTPGTLDWKIFQECLDAIQEWSQEKSVPVGFVVFPVVDAGRKGHNFDHYNVQKYGWLQDFNGVTDHIRERGIPEVLLMETFRQRAGDRYLAVSQTDGHPNSLAHQLAGEAVFSFLLSSKLVNCSDLKVLDGDPGWPAEKLLRDKADKEWLQFNESYEKQLEFFKSLDNLYPNDPWNKMELAVVYHGLHKWKEAYSAFAEEENLIPAFAAPWYHMSLCIEDRVEKENLLQKMLKVVPDHNLAMQDLAQLSLQQQQLPQACKLLFRLTEIPQSQEQYDQSKELYEKNLCDKHP